MWKLIVIMLVFYGVQSQDWTRFKTIHESSMPIRFQKHWVDKGDLSIHVLYSVYEGLHMESLYYKKIYSNGDISNPMKILPGQSHFSHSDISGANDGKTLFMAVCVKRAENLSFEDIYFSESSNGGFFWSKFIKVPRANLHDEISRYFPNIIYSYEREKVWLFYFAATGPLSSGSIYSVSRDKGASAFKREVEISSKFKIDGGLHSEISEGGPINVIYLSFHKQNSKYLYYMHSEDGIKWESHSCSHDSLRSGDNEIAVHPTLSTTVYSMHAYQSNYYKGMSLLKASNNMQSCSSGSSVFVQSILSDMFSTAVCEYERGMVVLSFGAKKREQVGDNLGDFAVKSLTINPFNSLGINPFTGKEGISYVISPKLSCRFLPYIRGHVTLSAVVYSSKSDKYYVYLTDARITSDWTTK